ncbi:MAG TPA: cation:proton antiporter [Methylibium sp.]|uniref:cation:proton antiporter n=1 Tax=Methylibium sp. TaxID=2067992 RepID=UPI002DBD558B|nr:cation:proton antiporter [Methylibium sp.]HEU4458387.1 cation:proton antiporter [Methylibium sp.]
MDPVVATQNFAARLAASAPGAESVPLWTLEGLRRADPVLGIALLVIVAVVVGEAVRRFTRLPRACGHMLVGVAASPLFLRLLERTDLDPWKPLLDLAVGVLVFELGTRIRPRWLLDNPLLALQCVAEGLLAGVAVTGVLIMLGVPALSAAFAGAVAMATSPVIVMAAVHDAEPRGQVTERLLMMTAVSGVLAVLALKTWRVIALADAPIATEWVSALVNGVVVLSGSFLLGAAIGLLLTWLSKPMRRTSASAVLQIGLLVLGAFLAAQWALSPLLALLVAGVLARDRMGHSLTVEPHLGTAGAALTVLLFVSIGLLSTVENVTTLWIWVLAIVLARAAGKLVAVVTLARPSGLGTRQSLALALALQPMASSTLLLSATTFGWPADTPQLEAGLLQALWIATTLMQLSGPIWIELALRRAVREAASS